MKEFEDAALSAAAASPCEKRKVGAVFTHNNVVLTSGYNYEVNDECCEDDDGNTKESVKHAEVVVLDALSENHKQAFKAHEVYVLYVTHEPCKSCQSFVHSFALRYSITINIKVVEQFMKFDTDKLRYDLIPPSAMKALAEVLTYGAKKYKPNNWRNGDKDRYIAALYRHLEAWRAGEQKDDESGMIHLAHALTNVAFLLELDNGHD